MREILADLGFWSVTGSIARYPSDRPVGAGWVNGAVCFRYLAHMGSDRVIESGLPKY